MTSLPLSLPGWTHVYAGKVRDLYIPLSSPNLDEAKEVLMVASDRVSAFDYRLQPAIPGKGAVLNQLSLWWMSQIEMPNHVLSTDVPDAVAGRAVIAKRLDMVPIECVVRGYLSGSGWAEYQATKSVCGVPLPDGLGFGDQLPEPIFTPAFKAPDGEHDENITFERTAELVGEQLASELRDASLAIYRLGATVAAAHGLILADTKFEFGKDLGRLTLADEVLTSDSSRYWLASDWQRGERAQSYDKQIVRNWLAANWDRTGTPPLLPPEIVQSTSAAYRDLFARLTGSPIAA